MRQLVVTLVAICMGGLCLCIPSVADPVEAEAQYWPRAGSGYFVEFTLFNHTGSDDLRALAVWTPDRTEAWAPEGWFLTVTAREVAWDTVAAQYMVGPGSSESGFLFVEDIVPDQYSWWAMGMITNYEGYAAPLLIPDPSSLLALGAGLAALGLPRLRRRRRG